MPRRAVLASAVALLAACNNPQPCPTPLEACDGQCVDVQSNRRHCGSCGVACAAADACIAGTCRPDVRAPCPDRAGGAFVTLGVDRCPGSAKLWITQDAFIDEAASYVGSTAPAPTPVFSVLPGSDCDEQWTWNVDADTPAFVATVTATACDVCPQAIQANVAAFVAAPGTWCPSDAKVLAVERRPPPP